MEERARPGITPARRAAYETLRRTFEEGAFTDRAFGSAASRLEVSGRELARGRRLAYGSVQRRGTCDAIVSRLAARSTDELDPAVIAALRLGSFELLFSDEVDEHAAVHQAVELAKAGLRRSGVPPGRARAAAGLVNAVLRRVADRREALRAELDDSTAEAAALAHSYPVWLARHWWRELGAAEARELMIAQNEPAEVAFRVNALRAEPQRLVAELREAGATVIVPREEGSRLDPLLVPAEAIVARDGTDRLRARVATGELVPQSRGSQAVVALLDPQPGERVLDVCAGPGIKTTQIAARIGDRGEIVSIEIDRGRAAEIEELCRRAGVGSARVIVADAAEADLGSGYDRVLVDAPCSDLGTLASRPDARWRKSPELVGRLSRLQRRILVRAARALAPGGTLVYSTCTIATTENEAVAAAALDHARELVVDPLGDAHPTLASRLDDRFVQLLPHRDRTTGFFIARFRRAA